MPALLILLFILYAITVLGVLGSPVIEENDEPLNGRWYGGDFYPDDED